MLSWFAPPSIAGLQRQQRQTLARGAATTSAAPTHARTHARGMVATREVQVPTHLYERAQRAALEGGRSLEEVVASALRRCGRCKAARAAGG